RLTVGSGKMAEIRLRLAAGNEDLADSWERALAERRLEADEFYGSLIPSAATTEEAMVARQGFAGMLWGKQFYHYDVDRWLKGDPAQPRPPDARWQGRNSDWQHLDNRDIISMPDKWEFPWYAAWDLAFHCVALTRLDPEFAKHQLILL